MRLIRCVNGRSGEPRKYEVPCFDGVDCIVSGTWTFDLDTLEAAYPGEYVGRPLLIGLLGGGGPLGADGPFAMTLSARLKPRPRPR